MNKKLLSNPPYTIRNAALEGAIEDCAAEPNDPKKLEILLRLFREAQLIVPVSFPKDANRVVVMKLLQGQTLKKGESVQLLPITLRNPEGKKFAPVFTTGEKVLDAKDFPYMVRVDAEQVIRNVMNDNADLEGVIINPQGKGFAIRKKAFDLKFSDNEDMVTAQADSSRQIRRVTKEEFAVMARNSAEKAIIPRRLFDEKAAFVDELEERGGELLSEIYARPYGDKVPSPYSEEDFSVMALSIDEDTTAICIELPAKGMAPHLGISAYVVWKSDTQRAYYYLIERGERGQDNVLCCVNAEGEHQELMTAPPIGSELTAVLDLISEEG